MDTETHRSGQRYDGTQIAFVCVQNAGRSQMAYAFAQRERDRRELDEQVDLLTGGTRPAEHVHEVVIEAMGEVGIDIADRTPQAVMPDKLRACDLVVTMGCSAEDVCPATWGVETRDWPLDDPHDRSLDEVRAIRDEVEGRVATLFDEYVDGSRASPGDGASTGDVDE